MILMDNLNFLPKILASSNTYNAVILVDNYLLTLQLTITVF